MPDLFHRMGPVVSRGILLLLSLIVVAFAAELFLRFARPVGFRAPVTLDRVGGKRCLLHRRSEVPGLAYELAPRVETTWMGADVRTNSFGMRGGEVAPERDDSLIRIAVVGDSFTFGFAVQDEKTYPRALERLLNSHVASPGRRFEVLNFGVGGYCARDEAAVIRHKLPLWVPDLVIIGYVLNDPESDPIQPLQAYFRGTLWWQRSHLFRLFVKTKLDWKMRRLAGGDYIRYLHTDPDKWENIVRAFQDISTMAESTGFDVLVSIFPMIPLPPRGRWDEYAYRDLHTQVAKAARAADLDVLDLYECLSTFETSAVALRDGHPSPLGHRVVAEAICSWLLQERSGFFQGCIRETIHNR